MDQNKTPLADALVANVHRKYIPFDVPGHKGRLQYLCDYFGKKCVAQDLNSRNDIDYLNDPTGVIREAEALAADAFGAENAFFMVGGTTSSVEAMIMSVCAPGDKIIIPRNAHYSVFNAIILSGAVPVYLTSPTHPTLGIPLVNTIKELEECIKANPDAKAVLINNPTYYGICLDVRAVADLVHSYGMKLLADEAHGSHFYFSDLLPLAAMHAGADMAAVSIHKTGGSLTQSAILLSSGSVDREHTETAINLIRTTSASYLLLASLDLARHNLANNGKQMLERTIALANNTREAINKIGKYHAFGQDIVDKERIYDFDCTKISVNTHSLGLAGIEVCTLLRDKFGIQVEFGDISNILAIASLGDRKEYHSSLVNALRRIKEGYSKPVCNTMILEFSVPKVVVSPRKAFYADKEYATLGESKGRISGASIMCYPPGIPILLPGELITGDIIDRISFSIEKECKITGLGSNNRIPVLKSNIE